MLETTVLISGSGTNLQALIDACASDRLNIKIKHVISNRKEATGLERAHKAGIPHSILSAQDYDSRDEYDQALARLIAADEPELIILAGFMRILGHAVVRPFENRMINLHPSLLPRFRGTDTYRKAIESGAVIHGASIHFVTAELDGGPVISQVRIPIEAGDSPESLARRLAPREHELMVATANLFAHYSVRSKDGTVFLDDYPLKQPLYLQANGKFENL
jgi:phosphoribosylglycinamide formyltransferase-1